MGRKQKHFPQKEELTELLAAKIVSRIIVKQGGLFLAGEGGGKLSILAQGDEGREGRAGKDGRDGVNGKNGIDGIDGKDGRNGKKPVNGVDYNVKDGVNGRDGKDGESGKDGVDGKFNF